MHSFIKESWYEILVTTIYIINFLAIINLIFREKRSIEATVAWVLVLTTAPAIGCILYIAVGRGISKNNMFKIKEAEDKILKENIIDTQIKLDRNDNFEPNLIGYKDMIYALANSNNSHFTTNNDVEIFPEPNDFFESLLEELKKAKHHINIQFYIFKDDEIGNKIIDFNKIFSTEYKTGAYIIYSYIKLKSMLLKFENLNCNCNYSKLNFKEGLELVKLLDVYEYFIQTATDELEPAIISRYIIKITDSVNEISNSIFDLENEKLIKPKLQLIKATNIVIKNALRLLGIYID